MKELVAWQNFYVVVGGSAGALIGLQFVVMSLVAARIPEGADSQAGQAFSTPTIIHFSTVLMLAAILCAPWDAIEAPTTLSGVLGLAGLIYSALNTRNLRRQTAYRLQTEDWIFHVVLPFVPYGALTASGLAAMRYPREALFGVGGTALLLLLIGIHNAWDAVLYHVFSGSAELRRQTSGEGSVSRPVT